MKKLPIVRLLIFGLALVLGSCGKGEEVPKYPKTFVKFSVQGTRFNGNYQIEKKEYAGDVSITAIHLPEGIGEEDTGAKVTLSMMDFSQNIGFALVAPPIEKLTEIIQNNRFDYELAFLFEEGVLEAKAISLNMTSLKVEDGSVTIKRMRGNFEGVGVCIFTEDGIKKEEAHTIKGDFEFNAP